MGFSEIFKKVAAQLNMRDGGKTFSNPGSQPSLQNLINKTQQPYVSFLGTPPTHDFNFVGGDNNVGTGHEHSLTEGMRYGNDPHTPRTAILQPQYQAPQVYYEDDPRFRFPVNNVNSPPPPSDQQYIPGPYSNHGSYGVQRIDPSKTRYPGMFF